MLDHRQHYAILRMEDMIRSRQQRDWDREEKRIFHPVAQRGTGRSGQR